MKVLLIEDSEKLQRSISLGLRHLGYAVDQATDGIEGLEYALGNEYDSIILDLMLPKMDGTTLLKCLRDKRDDTPVLILSAKSNVEDRVQNLLSGADDYLVKPFAFIELHARLQVLIRRSFNEVAGVFNVSGVRIDTHSKQVSFEGVLIKLTPTEYALLEILCRRSNQLFSADRLISKLYESNTSVSRNTVEAHLCALRKKLRAAGAPRIIQTKRGFGYTIDSF